MFSPDSRWMAFESDESGAPEVYVIRSMPSARGGACPSGGQTPRWRRDGKELFYMTPNGGVMSVTVTLGPFRLDAGTGTAVRGGRSHRQRHVRRLARRAAVSRQHDRRQGHCTHYGRAQLDIGVRSYLRTKVPRYESRLHVPRSDVAHAERGLSPAGASKSTRTPSSTWRCVPVMDVGRTLADRRLPFGDPKFTWLVRLNPSTKASSRNASHPNELRHARIEPEVSRARCWRCEPGCPSGR